MLSLLIDPELAPPSPHKLQLIPTIDLLRIIDIRSRYTLINMEQRFPLFFSEVDLGMSSSQRGVVVGGTRGQLGHGGVLFLDTVGFAQGELVAVV